MYPEISFFSQPTEHPNERVVFGGQERLHQRVHQTVLNSQSLERKGMGVQKVNHIDNSLENIGNKKCERNYPLHLNNCRILVYNTKQEKMHGRLCSIG